MEPLVDIGVRLRTERERLGKTQADMGAVAGVTRQTQSNYESGERAPDVAYLAAIAQVGVDVQYVVTGKRQLAASVQAQAPRKPSDAQSQAQTQGQGQTQGATDDWPATPTGPAISLEMMRRVVGLVDSIIRQRGQSPGRDKEIEMIVMAYNYVVVGDGDETKDTDTVQDREVMRVVRLVANG